MVGVARGWPSRAQRWSLDSNNLESIKVAAVTYWIFDFEQITVNLSQVFLSLMIMYGFNGFCNL